ncbi:MTH1187 family thiamine-binding protein [Micromonospora sp. Llam7]|uniref:MTH1187 family thiamine-binding protein n=1 Tax=Micromonospora tarapacensis TaxID=2835305 RepID=UPI001C83C088|nr:MTH1187 family thiamine-binding protein [Micromonospora tarapacensis]MBX7268872.1 MTH1187 family thiamine-binding protein [Micromonospora tarapacensis]
MSVLAAFSVTPLGVGEDVGEVVAEAIRVVRASGLPNQTDAMFTLIEGDSWDEVLDVIKQAVEAVAGRAPRVSTVIKVDYRPSASGALTGKVEAVERYIAADNG